MCQRAAFLSNIFLTIFAFLITNTEATTAGILGWSHISDFTFLLRKIGMQRHYSYARLVKSTCFCFSACISISKPLHISVFTFLLVKNHNAGVAAICVSM